MSWPAAYYLISRIVLQQIDDQSFSFIRFYDRRIRRIFPALLIVLVACLGFGWLSLLAPEFGELGKHMAAGASFVTNFALWSESGYFDAPAESEPLLHLWSLGIEEQFYIIWPVALWALRKYKRGAIILICATGALSFAINVATRRSHPTADFYSPLSRFWELQLGCLLAYVIIRGKTTPNRYATAISIIGATAIIAFILFSRVFGQCFPLSAQP